MASMASRRWRRAGAASGERSRTRLAPSLTLLYADVNWSNRLIRRGEGPDPIGPWALTGGVQGADHVLACGGGGEYKYPTTPNNTVNTTGNTICNVKGKRAISTICLVLATTNCCTPTVHPHPHPPPPFLTLFVPPSRPFRFPLSFTLATPYFGPFT